MFSFTFHDNSVRWIVAFFVSEQLLAKGHRASKWLLQDSKARVLALNHCAILPCCLVVVQQD